MAYPPGAMGKRIAFTGGGKAGRHVVPHLPPLEPQGARVLGLREAHDWRQYLKLAPAGG